MARLIEPETENSSTIAVNTPTTTTPNEKNKMSSVNMITNSQRKVSFKTKQYAYNHGLVQSKLVVTKSKNKQSSTVAELADKFNTILNDKDKKSKHQFILKRKHNIDCNNTIKDLSCTVKEAIRLFEQSNRKEQNNSDHNEGKIRHIVKTTTEENAHLKKNTKNIIIQQNSGRKVKRITSICESNKESNIECHRTNNSSKKSQMVVTKESSCEVCLKPPQLRPASSVEGLTYNETRKIRRPFSVDTNFQYNSENELSKTYSNECGNFLNNIKNNLRHTSLINLNHFSNLNDHSYQHKISDKYLINKNNSLKPELKPKPERNMSEDRRKAIANSIQDTNSNEDLHYNVHNNNNKNNITNNFQCQNNSQSNEMERYVEKNTSISELNSKIRSKTKIKNLNKLDHTFDTLLNSEKSYGNEFGTNSKYLKNNTSISNEHGKPLEANGKIIKNNRLSIPKINSDFENILNYKNEEENDGVAESKHCDKDTLVIGEKSNKQATESMNINRRIEEKINHNPISCSVESEKTTGVPSKPNNSFLWRSISKETKTNNEIITNNETIVDVNEKDYEIYTYIEINNNTKEENVLKNSSLLCPNNHTSTTYQSLPNLNHIDVDDTYEELNYFPSKMYAQIPPKNEFPCSKNTNDTLPKLPEKNNKQKLENTTSLRIHPDIDIIDTSKLFNNVEKYYENKNLPDLLKRADGKNLHHESKIPTESSKLPDKRTKPILSNIDDKYATIVKPIKRNHGESLYNYESIIGVKDEDHYISIQDDTYDDVLNVIQMDNCYESIKAASECGSFWEKNNSIYGIKAPSIISNTSSISAVSCFNDTSDEWVDVDQSDSEEQNISVFLPRRKVSRSSVKNKGWIQKVRRPRSKLSNVRKIITKKVGIKSTSIVVLSPSITQQPLPPVPKRRVHKKAKSTNPGLTELRCHSRCGVASESQELTVFLPSDEDNYNASTDHERDSFSDSFDSDSDESSELDSRDSIQERSLPPPPTSAAHLNQNIYGLVKEAGRQMKHWSLSSGLHKIRKMSVGAISQLPGQILPKSTEPEEKHESPQGSPLPATLPSRGRRWSSFKTRFRPHSTSTFYLEDQNNPPHPPPYSATENTNEVYSAPAPSLPDKNFRRKSIAMGSLSSNEKDHRRLSVALRPSSPPPPPPTSRTVSAGESSLKAFNKSNNSSNSSSWYAENRFFDPTGDIPTYLDKDQIKHLPPQGSAYWDNLWDSGNSSTPGATSNSDSMSDPGSDLHLRFIDEPLYQFYNSYIAECHLNGSSEENGYEEIGSSPSRTSMLEIMAPSNMCRSLWCQLPEVVESGVLDTLDVGERKLQEAKFELITSEASYFKSMSVLEKHFIASPLLADTNVLGKSDRKHLFGNVSAVRKCSEKLLAALEQCWQNSFLLTNICEIVYQHVTNKNFNIYIKYCSHQFLIDRTLKTLKENNPKFVEALAELEADPVCQSLSLHSFLMLPMQRVTRLPLLFDAVLTRLRPGRAEYESCHTVLATLNKIVHECNEEARKMERYYEMLMLSRLIKFSLKEVKCLPVISSSRWLVRSGSLNFVNVDAKTTISRKLNKTHFYAKLHLFLFTDLLVITKKKSDGSYSVIDYSTRAMMQMNALEDSVPPTNKYLILLTILENHENKTVEIVLSCDTESGRQRWLEATAPPASANPEETLYEQWDCPQIAVNHTYTAEQPDELNLQPGDVINVLRKMSDGWYYGERIRDGQKGWFPGNYTSEIASSHARAKNLKQRYRLLAISGSYLQSQQLSKKKL